MGKEYNSGKKLGHQFFFFYIEYLLSFLLDNYVIS